MNVFPRFLSGLVEIEGAWLINSYISGILTPFKTSQLGTLLRPFEALYATKVFNGNGEMLVNNVLSNSPLTIDSDEGTAVVNLLHDSTLQVTQAGELSVVPEIIMQGGSVEFRAQEPMQITVIPGDPMISQISLKYHEDDFNLDSGTLKTVDLNLTGQGAMGVRKADWTLGEDDAKLRVIHLDVSTDFQQTDGVLAIRNQGEGMIPFWQIGSGFGSTSLFKFDSAQTLSVPYIKLTESFQLANDYAATCGYVLQA